MRDPLTIADPKAAATFSSSRSRAILFALMASERSLQGLRVELDMSLTLLHYHVTRLRQLGLVRLVRSEPRNGRARKIYAASAPSFLVPVELESQRPRDGLRTELDRSLERERARFGGTGTVYFLDADGSPRMQRLRIAADESASGEWWWRVELSDADAKALGAEVRAVLAKYARRAGTGRKFLCNFALSLT
jgi:DNA-binding transcriptional ArsR family regulator